MRDTEGRKGFLVGDESQGEGWVLATTLGLRWHYPEDGIPALDVGKEYVWGIEGYRYASFQKLRGASMQPQTLSMGGVPIAADAYLFWHSFEDDLVVHLVGFTGQGSRENDEWYEWVCQVARSLNKEFEEGFAPEV